MLKLLHKIQHLVNFSVLGLHSFLLLDKLVPLHKSLVKPDVDEVSRPHEVRFVAVGGMAVRFRFTEGLA